MGTSSKGRSCTGTELVMLWYSSTSQCDVWMNRASETWPAVRVNPPGRGDLDTTARRRSLSRGQDSLRPYHWHLRLDREQFVQFGLARSHRRPRAAVCGSEEGLLRRVFICNSGSLTYSCRWHSWCLPVSFALRAWLLAGLIVMTAKFEQRRIDGSSSRGTVSSWEVLNRFASSGT